MIRFTIRFALALLLANAAYRIASEYSAHQRFRDAIREVASSRARTDDELRQRILTLAAQHERPLAASQFAIRRPAGRVRVEGSYRKPIRVLPLYGYRWRFELAVEVDAGTSL